MTNKTQRPPLTIDLDQFKLHIDIKGRIGLTLHFNSPSRRFYLSVIAFLVNEMKRLGKITSIPLERNLELLVLLNDTVGGSAGSSEKANLLPRIYRKWKDALPNLQEAPLFKVIGRQKKYDEGAGKAYAFSESEKDDWANLFEYTGSEENVRLKFAVDKMGASLKDVVIVYEGCTDSDAWDRFLSSLKRQVETVPETRPVPSISEFGESPISFPSQQRAGLRGRYRWTALIATVVMIAGAVTWVILEFTQKPALVNKASIGRMTFPLPDKPSIAVLPFVNMSDDPGQDFLVDGITDNIITALSGVPQLFVIARNSTFTYKGKAMKVQQVAEELGVRYVLEGSVTRSGDRIRLTAQLIDALKGHHLWAERYDREIKDLFDLQDDLTQKILIGINLKLTHGEQILYARTAKNIETSIKMLQCIDYLRHFNIDSNNRARTIAEEIIALEPSYWGGHLMVGSVHMMDYWLGSTKTPSQSLNLAIEHVEKSAAMTDRKGRSLEVLGHLYALKKDYDKAIEVGEQAVAMIPNGADALAWLAMSLNYAGRPEEALPLFQKAMRLNPFPPSFYYLNCGNSYRMTGRFEEAIAMYKKAVQLTPNSALAHMNMAATYGLMGKEEEARAAAADLLRINPKFSVEYAAKIFPYQSAHIEQFIQGLRKAGLK